MNYVINPSQKGKCVFSKNSHASKYNKQCIYYLLRIISHNTDVFWDMWQTDWVVGVVDDTVGVGLVE